VKGKGKEKKRDREIVKGKGKEKKRDREIEKVYEGK
jgi:hypothetical protein